MTWEEGEERRILNSRLFLLQPGRPAVLMKTSEQTDCPTLLESRGRGRITKRWKGDDETKLAEGAVRAGLVLDVTLCAFHQQHVPGVYPMSGIQVMKM